MPNNRKEETATTNVGTATTNTRQMNKPALLSLPDEALDIIFRHLDAFDKSQTCQKRDAFSLALANKRLLGIFRCRLSTITPRISNNSLPTVAFPHMLSVVLLARSQLRELHVSKSSYHILPLLPHLCLNLTKLVVDLDFREKHVPVSFSKLRSLSINRPCRETLHSLSPPPEELHLTELPIEFTDELVEILRHPLKKFHLHIGVRSGPLRLSDRLLSVLREVCPKIEEVSIRITRIRVQRRNYFLSFLMEELLRNVNSTKRNAASKCQKMVLHGEGLEKLMTHAHPKALVEISKGQQTVVNHAGNCYAKGIISAEEYLREPFVSMINTNTQILIASGADPRWKDFLKDVRFKRVVVKLPEHCNGFELNADAVDVHANRLWRSETDWKWLQDVDEVMLVGRSVVYSTDEAIFGLRSLAKLLKTFRGTRRVWLQIPVSFGFWSCGNLQCEIVKTLEALNEFETRGGDATTLRKMLDILLEHDASD